MMKHVQTWLALAAATTLLVVLPADAVASRSPIQPTLVSTPNGLVVVIDTSALSDSTWLTALNNSSISGVALQIHWSDIEPTSATPDWSKLDTLFSAAVSAHKWVHLIMYAGFFTPAWAEVGAKTDTFDLQYGPGAHKPGTLPMPWDPVYLGNWLTFVQQVSNRYATSPALTLVAAGGPTSVSAEFTLPNKPAEVKQWQRDGYTSAKYIGAWQKVLQTFAAYFPSQYISLSLGTCLGINDKGKIDASERDRCRQAIIDKAKGILGRRFTLQLSDVHAGPGPHSLNSKSEDQAIINYIGTITTGFQLRTSAENDSAVMGAKGNPPLALNKSINLALATNGAGQHVNYIEVYEPDVLASEMQIVLSYAAAAFNPKIHVPFRPRVLY